VLSPRDAFVDVLSPRDAFVDVLSPRDAFVDVLSPRDAFVDVLSLPDAAADVLRLPDAFVATLDSGGVVRDGASDLAGEGLCTKNSDCVRPLVCNLNTNKKCGPAVYTQVDVSDVNTCAVVSDGTLRCWGGNSNGQLGTAGTGNQLIPVVVPDQTDVRSVATGWGYTCVLLFNGQVNCWGRNVNGNLGCPTPTTTSNGQTCMPYGPGSTVDVLIAGGERACVVLKDRTVECWGRNDHYQVGDGTTSTASRPVRVVGVSDVVSIATGIWQACVVTSEGSVRCWGANDRGQLGTGKYADTPVTNLPGLDILSSRVVSAMTAEDHSCYSLSDGTIRCSGDDNYGQLGDGGSARTATLVLASKIPVSMQLMAVGINVTCVIGDESPLQCLGNGTSGQLGHGAFTSSSSLVTVKLPDDFSVWSVATKYSHLCALGTEGSLMCWGLNSSGQLGNNTTKTSNVPVEVAPPGP
jgi:alpha-tubulin suppressor-like RCC1 family protein